MRASAHMLRNVTCCSIPPSEGSSTQDETLTTEKVSESELLRSSRSQSSKSRRRQADSTDWVSSQLTRRFG